MSVLKSDLVTLVAERTGYTKTHTRIIVDAMLDIIKEQVNLGEQIKFPRYFTLKLEMTKPRLIYDVSRDERKINQPHKRVVFVPSPQFLDE